jgi:hypothetical protein
MTIEEIYAQQGQRMKDLEQQNAELKRKLAGIIESYERELKAWENMETNDLNRGFVDGNKRAINAMLIELKTIKH